VLLSGPGGLTPTQIAVVFDTNTFVVAAPPLSGRTWSDRAPRRADCRWVPVVHCVLANPACLGRRFGASSRRRDGRGRGCGNRRGFPLSASMSSLLNDLAPPELRGRYNAIDALIVSTGNIVGPLLVVAVYTRRGTGTTLLLLVLAGGCAAAGLISRALPPRPDAPALSGERV